MKELGTWVPKKEVKGAWTLNSPRNCPPNWNLTIGVGFSGGRKQEAALALGGVSVGWRCSLGPRDLWLSPSTCFPRRANSSASTSTLPGTSWAPTSRLVSSHCLEGCLVGGRGVAAKESGSWDLTAYGKQVSTLAGKPGSLQLRNCASVSPSAEGEGS